MNIETKKYFRKVLNEIDHNGNLINQVIENDYLMTEKEFSDIYNAINTLKFVITNYQLSNKYI